MRLFIFLFRLLIVFGIAWGLASLTILKQAKIISPLPDTVSSSPSFIQQLFTQKKSPEVLKKQILNLIGNKWRNYSVYVKDFNSDFTMGIDETVIFAAASVNKVPILATVYYQAQKGEVDLDKQVTLQKEDVQDYGSGVIRYDKPGSVYSVKTLSKLMIQQSDNTAAFILNTYIVPTSVIKNLLHAWGLIQTDIASNKTSNRDMAILFEKIATGKITSTGATEEMFAFFKDTAYEDRIPAKLPKGVTVYHKTGDGEGLFHDVGIVMSGKTKYYIGIFTTDITDEPGTKTLMAQISRKVFDFMK